MRTHPNKKYLPEHFIRPEDEIFLNFAKKGGVYYEKVSVCSIYNSFAFGWM